MSALIGGFFALVGVVRLLEWACNDHDRDDLVTGIVFVALAVVALLIHGVSA